MRPKVLPGLYQGKEARSLFCSRACSAGQMQPLERARLPQSEHSGTRGKSIDENSNLVRAGPQGTGREIVDVLAV
jgi:hypothetical protein